MFQFSFSHFGASRSCCDMLALVLMWFHARTHFTITDMGYVNAAFDTNWRRSNDIICCYRQMETESAWPTRHRVNDARQFDKRVGFEKKFCSICTFWGMFKLVLLGLASSVLHPCVSCLIYIKNLDCIKTGKRLPEHSKVKFIIMMT